MKATAERLIRALTRWHLVSPEMLCRLRYVAKFRRLPNISHPRDLNEWIMHLEFRTDTSGWVRAADKLAMRALVEECGLGHMLPRLYASGASAHEIDWESLPGQFVVKTNNGCGTVHLVRDKGSLDLPALKRELNEWLRTPFGYVSAEPHYTRIRPMILVEELLPCPDGTLPIDYKIWCIEGEPVGCMVCTGRKEGRLHQTNINWYDIPGWKRHPELISKPFRNNDSTPCPKSLDKMIEASRRLARGFKIVRVDFYDIAGRPYLGELTFTSNGGRMAYLTPDLLKELGQRLS